MEKKVFRSRISVLLSVIILLAILPVIIVPIVHSDNIFNHGFYVSFGVMIFVIFLLGGIRYEITDEKLLIKMYGFLNGSYSISQITSVERSYNLLSSPAASLKRLRVDIKEGYGKWLPYCLISPVREQEFLETLKRMNPDIDIRVNDKIEWWRFWDWDF